MEYDAEISTGDIGGEDYSEKDGYMMDKYLSVDEESA